MSVFAEIVSKETEAAAHALGLQLHVLRASAEGEIDAAFPCLAQLRAGALVIAGDAFFTNRIEQLAALTLRHAVPAIYSEFAYVGYRGKTGKHLLAVSFSQFDPTPTSDRMRNG